MCGRVQQLVGYALGGKMRSSSFSRCEFVAIVTFVTIANPDYGSTKVALALLSYASCRDSDVVCNCIDALFVVVASISLILSEYRRYLSADVARASATYLNELSWARAAALQVGSSVALSSSSRRPCTITRIGRFSNRSMWLR